MLPDKICTMKSKFQWAQSLRRLRKYHEAVELLEALLAHNIEILGFEHPMTRRTKFLLANLSRHRGNLLRVDALKGELSSKNRIRRLSVVKNEGLGTKSESTLAGVSFLPKMD